MPSISVASLEALNQAGVLKFTNKALMVGDGDASPLTTPFDSSAALQAFPAGYYSGGSITTDGVTISADMSADAVNIDQAVAAVRNDVTSDTLSLKVAFAETGNKVVQALFMNQNIADVALTPFFKATRPASGIQPKRRLIMVSEDTLRNIILVQFFGTATVTAKDDLQLARSTATSWGCTLSPVPDNDIIDDDGNPSDMTQWIGGSGWAALAGTLSLSPATATLSLAGTTTQQLTATFGSTDVSSTATYTSSDTDTATVSSSGLVTGEAAGTATITASYEGHSATSSITVTA